MARANTLSASLVPIDRIGPSDRNAMWDLFSSYYDAVCREKFDGDLAGKSHAFLLRAKADGSVQGFSTIATFERTVQGRKVVGVFSGDTIVARAHWSQTALQRAFFVYVMEVKLRNPRVPVYWFLISKGYKTYLLLARNFPEYWPRWDRATPAWQAAVLDDFARERFGQAWRPEQGLLKFEQCEGRLKGGVAQIDDRARRLPEVRFFEARNPGHAQGDELCCLGRVDVRLGVSYTLKLARKALGLGGRRT